MRYTSTFIIDTLISTIDQMEEVTKDIQSIAKAVDREFWRDENKGGEPLHESERECLESSKSLSILIELANEGDSNSVFYFVLDEDEDQANEAC